MAFCSKKSKISIYYRVCNYESYRHPFPNHTCFISIKMPGESAAELRYLLSHLGCFSCFFSFPLWANQPSLSEAAVQPVGAWSTANKQCPREIEGKRKGGEKPERKSAGTRLSLCPTAYAELLASGTRKVTLMRELRTPN